MLLEMKEPMNFRTYLKEELSLRCRNNPNYSLRAFASSIDCDPSYLSKVLSGKKNVQKRFIKRVGESLGLGDDEVKLFISELDETESLIEPSEYDYSDYTAFQFLSEWYYDAILELAKLKEHNSSPAWISKKMGVEIDTIKEALENLQRAKFIETQA
jgi:uncharacterized protein (TIGR02147 family)